MFIALLFFGINISAEISWNLSADGTLSISGTGAMPDYSSPNYAPWYSSRENIKKVIIEDGITNIGNNAFVYCMELTSVTIPNGVTSIGNSAFEYCRGLTSVTIPNSVITIGSNAFMSSGITSLVIPQYVTTIGGYAFTYCYALTSVTIPNSVTSIGDHAFASTGITNVVIPQSAKIGEMAFASSGLTGVLIPRLVTDIGAGAFSWCENLLEITVEEGNLNYSALTGVLFNAEKTKLFCYPIGKPETSYTVPDRVTSIEYEAFGGCRKLTSIDLPNSLTTIGIYAFDYCTGLSRISIPNSVTEIGRCAFWNCTGLSSIDIPNSVTNIREQTFTQCSGLTSISLPNSLTNIGLNAFDKCTGLTNIAIPNSVTNIGDQAFRQCTALTSISVSWNNPAAVKYGSNVFSNVKVSDVILDVPTGTKQAYQQVATWTDFAIVEDRENIALLADLTVSHGKLFPNFSMSDFSYSATVPSSIENITLTATPFAEGATVEGAGTKTLDIGENNFEIIVTAPDGATRQIYTVKVSRFTGDYLLELDGFANQYKLVPYPVPTTDYIVNISVISGRYLYFTLTTGDISGNLPFRFALTGGRTCERTIAVLPNSIYRIRLYLLLETLPDVTTKFDAYGRPTTTTVSYTYWNCDLVVTENGNTALNTEMEIPNGSITTATVSEVTFEGNVTGISEINKDKVKLSVSNNNLYVNTPQAESIEIYSIIGKRLFRQSKPAGEATFPIGNIRDKVLIVKGGSGWVKKQVRVNE